MEKFKKFGAAFFIGVYLLVGFAVFTPKVSLALDEVKFTPQISIPGSDFQQTTGVQIGSTSTRLNTATNKVETIMQSDLLARYIQAFYNWGLSIVGVVAVLMLMAGGLIWLTSAGDSGKIGSAKKMIEGSLLGTALLVGAWFFLNTINPNLTKLPAIETVMIIPYSTGCCQLPTDAFMGIQKDCADKSGVFDESSIVNNLTKKCEKTLCCYTKASVTNNLTPGTMAIVKPSYCVDSLDKTCVGSDKEKIPGLCSIVPKCSSITVDCTGKANGDTCPGGTINGWCYGGKCYEEKGGLGDFCGTKAGKSGVCINATNECKNTTGRGRSCGDNLQCCNDDVIIK